MAELIFPDGFEEKTTIAQDDMILMADSEDSNKIKKAKYSNLKGEQGDPGQDGQDGTDGASIVSAAFSGNDIVFTKDNSQTVTLADAKTTLQGPQGEDGPEGEEGPAGNGIASITSSKSGKVTTVTITETNGDVETFTVSDGADGQGAGDVVGPNSSTDGHLAVFDGTTGKLIKDGGAIGTAATKNTGTSAGNVPVLDSNGKLNTNTLPGVALTDTFTVTNKADLTSLSSADQGDIGIVTSESKTYVLSQAPYSTAANWKELLSPTDAVTSVNSKTGAVTLNADDISDSTTTNKFVTATDKTTWSGKQDALTLPSTPTSGHIVTWGADNKTLVDGGAVPTGVPAVGTNGQVLTVVSGAAAWANAPASGIQNDTTGTTTTVTAIRAGTEAEYALITPNANTIYHIY